MKKISMLLLFISILFLSNFAIGDEYNPGKMWSNWSEATRVNWVWGFSTGQELLLEELENKSSINLKYVIQVKDADTISEIMTQYYQDPSNTYIPWKYMTHIAKMKLEGRKNKDIQDELESLRQYANYMRNKAKSK